MNTLFVIIALFISSFFLFLWPICFWLSHLPPSLLIFSPFLVNPLAHSPNIQNYSWNTSFRYLRHSRELPVPFAEWMENISTMPWLSSSSTWSMSAYSSSTLLLYLNELASSGTHSSGLSVLSLRKYNVISKKNVNCQFSTETTLFIWENWNIYTNKKI